MNYFDNALDRCCIPSIQFDLHNYDYYTLRKEYQKPVIDFVHDNSPPNSVAIIGDDFFEWTIRMCRSALDHKITRNMRFFMYGDIVDDFGNFVKSDAETIIVCGIQDNGDRKVKFAFHRMLSHYLQNNVSIMISASNVDDIKRVCDGCWHIVDRSFTPIKV